MKHAIEGPSSNLPKKYSKYRWFPLVLSLTVFPGLGHFYLKKKIRGAIFMILTALISLGGLARFMSVMFALANVRERGAPPLARGWRLLLETWRLEAPILLAFLAALLLIWLVAALDCWWTLKRT